MQTYYNVKLGLTAKAKLLTSEQIAKLKIPKDQDAYVSIFKYSEAQKKQIEETGCVYVSAERIIVLIQD